MTCQCGDPVYAEGYCGVCYGTFLINEGRTGDLMAQLSDIAQATFSVDSERRAEYDEPTSSGTQRKRARAATVGEHIPIGELFVRDGGICGLCGGTVSWDLPHPLPDSKSVDHIVPLCPIRGARPGTHTWDNVQLAHLWCNFLKGNRQ